MDGLRERLAAPFPADEIGWKPQSVKGNRALAVAYIDARNVEDRLDDVFGPGGWRDDYAPLPSDSVICRLSCLVDGVWVEKCDVGSPSEQPDGGDRMKAAFSDALKRAAVKWGIGRFLYELPLQWCDYDPVKKQFTNPPQLPAKFRTPPKTKPAGNGQQTMPVGNPPADPESHRKALAAAKDVAELQVAWGRVPPELKTALAGEKDKKKAELSRQR